MLNNLFYFLLVILSAILQISLFSDINLVLILVVFVTVKNPTKALLTAVIGGFLLELYSPYVFGIYILAIICAAVLTYYLFKKFFTHYSFLSLIALITAATMAYNIILLIGDWSLFWSLDIHGQIIMNCLFFAIVYFVAKLVSGKLQTSFILRE